MPTTDDSDIKLWFVSDVMFGPIVPKVPIPGRTRPMQIAPVEYFDSLKAAHTLGAPLVLRALELLGTLHLDG